MYQDFVEMLCALSDEGAEYLIVGAYALGAHGHPRATGDLDIWVRPSAENAPRVRRAIEIFGMPVDHIAVRELALTGLVLQFGFPPERIDIMTSVSGVTFDEAWPRRILVKIEGREHPVIGKDDFIRNKRASGRPKDLIDVHEIAKKP
ncbi:MAG TPA: hypothetical protein VJZ76_18680 [Thermoanaerobaculia bacterium]|nr:hypothetical protein [Thermoanaerobaculia bacterium]